MTLYMTVKDIGKIGMDEISSPISLCEIPQLSITGVKKAIHIGPTRKQYLVNILTISHTWTFISVGLGELYILLSAEVYHITVGLHRLLVGPRWPSGGRVSSFLMAVLPRFMGYCWSAYHGQMASQGFFIFLSDFSPCHCREN